MPRPKRTRVAPSAPLRVVDLREAQQTARLATPASWASSEDVAAFSTDSDGLVTSNALGWNRRGVPAMEARMKGALVHQDIEGGALLLSRNRYHRTKLEGDLRLESNARAVGRRNQSKTRGGPENDRGGTNANTQRSHKVETVAKSGTVSMKPSSQDKNSELYARPETVILGSNLKPRQRKPSLLYALESQQKLIHAQVEDAETDNSFDMDISGPDEEPTPFGQNTSYGASVAQDSALAASSGSRKRKRGEVQNPQMQISGTQQSLGSSPPADTREQRQPRILARDSFNILADSPSTQSSPSLLPRGHLPRRQTEAQLPSPSQSPRSSNSSSSAQASLVVKPTCDLPAPKPLTTARLQNLLPRRRLKSSSNNTSGLFDFQGRSDIEASSVVVPSSDADELSLSEGIKLSRPQVSAIDRRKPPKVGKPILRQHRHRTSKTYSRVRQLSPGCSDLEESDQDEDADTRAPPLKPAKPPKLQSPERKRLQATAKWFKEEVDQWQLELEDVSMHSQSSLMRDAR